MCEQQDFCGLLTICGFFTGIRSDTKRQESCLRASLVRPNAGSTTLGSSGLPRPTSTTRCRASLRPRSNISCQVAYKQLGIVPLLFLAFASLVSCSITDISQQICVATRFLDPPPNARNRLNTKSNIGLNVHNGVHIVHQNLNPRTSYDAPSSHFNHHLILWCGLLAIVVELTLAGYLIHVGLGRYWYQTWEDQTGHIFQDCFVRDNRRVLAGRGSAAPVASGNSVLQHNVLLSLANVQPLLTEAPENETYHANDVTRQIAPGSSSSRTLSAPVLAPLSSSAEPSFFVWIRSIAGAAKNTRRPLRSGLAHADDGPTKTKWFIFVVAVSTTAAPDPKFDLTFLQNVFKPFGSANVCLEWLTEEDATPENMRARLCSLYHKAQQANVPSRLLVYLTGTGDGFSRLCISDDKVVTEQDVGSWLEDVRSESDRPQPSPSVFLDICRETMKRRDPVDHHLALIWSCSAGQLAYGIPLGEGLPSSIFLIALFSACQDALVGSDPFEKAFMLRMNHLAEFIEFLYHKVHEASEACKNCSTWVSGRCPPPVPQKPEWKRDGLETLVHLGNLIMTEFPDRAREVSDALARRMAQWGFLNTIYNDSSTTSGMYGPAPRDGQPAAQHLRGANKRISQVTEFGA